MQDDLSPRLRKLDERLAALPAESDAMLLSELDGYIAGLLVCPALIMPSEWLPPIWSRDEEEAGPVVESAAELQSLTRAIMEHYNAVAGELQRGGHQYAPIYDADPRLDDVMWEFWIGGFERAIALRPESWAAVLESDDEDAVAALTGLVALISVARRSTGDLEIDKETADELAEDAPDLIPLWVEALNDWQLKNNGATRDCADQGWAQRAVSLRLRQKIQEVLRATLTLSRWPDRPALAYVFGHILQ